MANIIVVGAGAAGLFVAGTALENGCDVTIVEHMKSAGRKLLITAKGRCNVTNNCDVQEFLLNVRSNSRFLYSCINNCSPAFVMNLFENQLGIPLKTERGKRVFPKSDDANDILNALLKRAKNASFIFNTAVKSLICENNEIKGVLLDSGKKLLADKVIIATGGASYPVTGSTGDGYKLAKSVGHNIIKPEPCLVSLVEKGNSCTALSGLSLRNIELTLWENDKKAFNSMGEMLFTHFGISGPLVLSASAHIKDFNKYTYKVTIDTKPALSKEVLQKRIDEDFLLMPKKNAQNSLVKLLPASMREAMLKKWGIDINKQINQITRQERNELVDLLKAYPINIKSKGDLDHAVITSGGVDVKEINPKTMESKLCKGLYFAGEVIDVDAYTGGFNLGIAFATAYAAGNAACN